MYLIINETDKIKLTSCKRESICNNLRYVDRTIFYFPPEEYNEDNLNMLKSHRRGYDGKEGLHLEIVEYKDVDGQPEKHVLKEFFNVPGFLCVELIFFEGMLPDDEPFFMASVDEIIF